MKRSKRLKADPEKVRQFLARGRGSLERSSSLKNPGKPFSAKRKVGPREGPLDPASWRREVFRASGGTCIVTGTRALDADDPRFHAHHAIAAQQLRKRGLHGRVWDRRNGLWVAEGPHMAHEHTGGSHRIPRDLLPTAVWEFARELDAIAGTEWATAHLERTYPAAGPSRDDESEEN